MLSDINDFAAINEVYKECRYYFCYLLFSLLQFLIYCLCLVIKPEFPARSCYQVGRLPIGARLEVEAIGLCGNVETEIISN